RFEERRARLHPAIFAVLAGKDGACLLGERALHMDTATAPLNVSLEERCRLAPPQAGQDTNENERMPPGETSLRRGDQLWSLFLREEGERSEPPLVDSLPDEELEISGRVRARERFGFEDRAVTCGQPDLKLEDRQLCCSLLNLAL